MPDFWLDANVFIGAKNGPYGFDLVPGFWRFLEQKASEGIIASSLLVYEELQHGEDELSEWAKGQNDKGFFVEPDESVQAAFREIAHYVNNSFPTHQASRFLGGADPWIIAHAKAHGGRVVTHETRAGPRSTKPKIPDIAGRFGVQTINIYDVLRELGWRADNQYL